MTTYTAMPSFLAASNVQTVPPGGDWRHCFEGAFLENYFENLQRLMGPAFNKWTFHILHHNQAVRAINLAQHGREHILLWLSDESGGSADEAAAKFEFVFKAYRLPDSCPANVYPFPLFGCSAVFKQEPIPIGVRRNDVFFSGNLNRHRSDLFLRLAFPALDHVLLPTVGTRSLWCLAGACRLLNLSGFSRTTLPSSFIQFNHGFARGLPPQEYAQQLANAKICLCPPGFITGETMRHFEAMQLGCVVLSEELPPSPFYKRSPIIQLRSWRGVRNAISSFLQDPDNLEQISSDMQTWWKEYCSPHAAARKTAEVLIGRS